MNIKFFSRKSLWLSAWTHLIVNPGFIHETNNLSALALPLLGLMLPMTRHSILPKAPSHMSMYQLIQTVLNASFPKKMCWFTLKNNIKGTVKLVYNRFNCICKMMLSFWNQLSINCDWWLNLVFFPRSSYHICVYFLQRRNQFRWVCWIRWILLLLRGRFWGLRQKQRMETGKMVSARCPFRWTIDQGRSDELGYGANWKKIARSYAL